MSKATPYNTLMSEALTLTLFRAPHTLPLTQSHHSSVTILSLRARRAEVGAPVHHQALHGLPAKRLLAESFAKALSELPSEKVINCWAPLRKAWDDKVELHAQVGAPSN